MALTKEQKTDIIKKFAKTEFKMPNGKDVSDAKGDKNLVKEVADINYEFIKTKQEVDWASLKKHLDVDDEGNVIYKDTGEFLESIVAQETLPYIEVKTE